MHAKKTVAERERELLALVRTARGRKTLQRLEDRYRAAGGIPGTPRPSVVTNILLYEREKGLLTP